VRNGAELDASGEIIVEVRLSDDALARRISNWLDEVPTFVAGAAHGARAVIIADHVPDDTAAPVILFLSEDDVASWPRDERIAARLAAPIDFVKLRIAIEAAAYGMSVTDSARKSAFSNGERITLTNREIEVLHLLAEGASNKVIARALGISSHTVKFHVAAILEKLSVASRTEAVMNAIRLGLLLV
jgi:DNA-binding NarL/FixJ family response regulator